MRARTLLLDSMGLIGPDLFWYVTGITSDAFAGLASLPKIDLQPATNGVSMSVTHWYVRSRSGSARVSTSHFFVTGASANVLLVVAVALVIPSNRLPSGRI